MSSVTDTAYNNFLIEWRQQEITNNTSALDYCAISLRLLPPATGDFTERMKIMQQFHLFQENLDALIDRYYELIKQEDSNIQAALATMVQLDENLLSIPSIGDITGF